MDATFTKERPCSKVDLWNCFRNPLRQGFRVVDLTTARSYLGRSVPRLLVIQGRAKQIRSKDQDLVFLTAEGKAWLVKGTTTYLRNHPEKLNDVRNPIPEWVL